MFFPEDLKSRDSLKEMMTEITLASVSGFKSKHDDAIDTISMLAALKAWKPTTPVKVTRDSNNVYQSDAHVARMHAHTLKSLMAMFHAEHARRRAMEIEQAALVVEHVDWAACRRLYGALVDEMESIKPAFLHYLETRVIP
jgi:hypothetical protein